MTRADGHLNRARAALLVAVLCAAVPARAQNTSVNPANPVYRTLEIASSAGLIDSLLFAERPMSRKTVARLVREAEHNMARLTRPAPALERLLHDAAAEFTDDSSPSGLHGQVESARFLTAAASSPARGVPSTPTGDATDAAMNPLLDNAEGFRYSDGGTQAFDAYARASFGSHLIAAVDGRLSFGERRQGAGTVTSASTPQAYVRLDAGNVLVDLGRDYQLLGQGRFGGVLGTVNDPGLTMLRISSDAPFVVPGWLRFLGPMRGILYVADLGADQNYPHAKMVGYELSILPTPRLELGVHVLDQMGGNGAPGASFGDRIADALVLVDALFMPDTDFLFSNKLAGFDGRYRLSHRLGLDAYFDMAFDDFDPRRWHSILYDDSGYLYGLSASCLLECGTLHLQAEWHYTGYRYYTHGYFSSGVTNHGYFIGDELGPRARGAYLSADVEPRDGLSLSIDGAYEMRSGDIYDTAFGAEAAGFRFVRIATGPSEDRQRVVASATFGRQSAPMHLKVGLGGERLRNFDFVAGANRFNGLAQAEIDWRLGTLWRR